MNDLEPNTQYLFRVRAFNSIGASPWSELLTARTAPAPPSTPENFRCAQTSCSALSFAWDIPSLDHGAEVTSYQLEFAPASRGQRAAEKTAWRSAYKGDAVSYTLTGLPPGAQYRARVRATNAYGWGPWSDVLTAATEPDVPGTPDAPGASGRTGTSVRLTWAPPLDNHGSPVTEYELQMAQGGPDGQFNTLVSGLDTNWKHTCSGKVTQSKVTGLKVGGEWSIRIRGIGADGAGHGEWSSPVTVAVSLDAVSLLHIPPGGGHHARSGSRSSAASDSELAALPIMTQRTHKGTDCASVTSGTDFGGTDDGRGHGRGHRRGK